MFGIIRKIKHEVRDRTIYMEVFGDNKVSYRVTAGKVSMNGEEVTTYGVEAEDIRKGEYESIADFSRDIEDAVDFAEMLIAGKVRPSQIYTRALTYLWISI